MMASSVNCCRWLGIWCDEPREVLGDVLFELRLAVLRVPAIIPVLSFAVEPDASLPFVLAGLVLRRLRNKLCRSHDPSHIHAFGVEDEPVVVAKFMWDRSKKRGVTVYNRLRAGLDLNRREGLIRSANNRINGVIVDKRQVDIDTLAEHTANNPIFDAFAEGRAVPE